MLKFTFGTKVLTLPDPDYLQDINKVKDVALKQSMSGVLRSFYLGGKKTFDMNTAYALTFNSLSESLQEAVLAFMQESEGHYVKGLDFRQTATAIWPDVPSDYNWAEIDGAYLPIANGVIKPSFNVEDGAIYTVYKESYCILSTPEYSFSAQDKQGKSPFVITVTLLDPSSLDLQTSGNKLYGIKPVPVVTFWYGDWDFDSKTLMSQYCESYSYATIDSLPWAPVENAKAYAGLLSIGNIGSTPHKGGFGTVTQIAITLADPFGKFYNLMRQRNLYTSIQVAIHILFTDTGGYYKIFDGKTSDPVKWQEASRTISISAVTDQITAQKKIGFTPSVNNTDSSYFIPDPPIFVDGLQKNIGAGTTVPCVDSERAMLQAMLNTNTWPQLFGWVRDYVIQPIAKVPTFKINDNIPCRQGFGTQFIPLISTNYVQDWSTVEMQDLLAETVMIIPLEENNIFTRAVKSTSSITNIIDTYHSILGLSSNRMTVEIAHGDECVLCQGYLIDRYFFVTAFNIPYYQNLSVYKTPEYYLNPEYIDWESLQGLRGTLIPEAEAYAASDPPVQYIRRPDYIPNMLRLPSSTAVLLTSVGAGADTLNVSWLYGESAYVIAGSYFKHGGTLHIITSNSGTQLVISPALNVAMAEDTQIEICSHDTPWLMGKWLELSVTHEISEDTDVQLTDDNGRGLYVLPNGQLTTDAFNANNEANDVAYQTSTTLLDKVYYCKVVLQDGAKIYCENMTDYMGSDCRSAISNANINEIIAVTGNARLATNGFELRIRPKLPLQDLTSDQRYVGFVQDPTGSTTYANQRFLQYLPFFIIPAGSTLTIVDWWATYTYVVSTNMEHFTVNLDGTYHFNTWIEKVWANVNGAPIPILGPQLINDIYASDQYTRLDYSELDIPSLLFPLGSEKSTLALHEEYRGVYYPSEESKILKWPAHVAIMLKPTSFMAMLKTLQGDNNLHISAVNALNTDTRILKAVLDYHTLYGYLDLSTIKTYDNISYGLPDQEHFCSGLITTPISCQDFLAQLAFENAKMLQITNDKVGWIDMFRMIGPYTYEYKAVFDETIIDKGTLEYEYVPASEIRTKFNINFLNPLTVKKFASLSEKEQLSPYLSLDFRTILIDHEISVFIEEAVTVSYNNTVTGRDPAITTEQLIGPTTTHLLSWQQYDDYEKFIPQVWPDSCPWGVDFTAESLVQRPIDSVLRWWLIYRSRTWLIASFSVPVEEVQKGFLLSGGDRVKVQGLNLTFKKYTDEDPDAWGIQYVEDLSQDESFTYSGPALVLSTDTDLKQCSTIVRVLLPITPLK